MLAEVESFAALKWWQNRLRRLLELFSYRYSPDFRLGFQRVLKKAMVFSGGCERGCVVACEGVLMSIVSVVEPCF